MSATLSSERLKIPDNPEVLLQLSVDQGWGDGLPLFPPTEQAVAEMLRFSDREPHEELGDMAPGNGVATIEKLAINAVMAGCRPEYFPIVVAATEALLDPAFNLYSVQATTHPCGALVIVSGPLAQELNINGAGNAFGQGWRANATIGRALRLIMVNVGGAIPGVLDRSTMGQPGKFSSCVAENEAESPWEPWRVSLGFPAEATTVTIHGGEAPHNINDHDGQSADSILRVIDDTVCTIGTNHFTLGGEVLLVIGPEHAESIAREGFSKNDLRRELFRRMRRAVDFFPPEKQQAILRRWYDGDRANTPEGLIPLVQREDDILIMVAGGAGKHSMCVTSFGNTRATTRAVARKDGAPISSIRETFGTAP